MGSIIRKNCIGMVKIDDQRDVVTDPRGNVCFEPSECSLINFQLTRMEGEIDVDRFSASEVQ